MVIVHYARNVQCDYNGFIFLSFFFIYKEKSQHYNMKITYGNVLPGFLLLLLAVSGNFLGNTFGCQIYDTLTNSILYKNILVFLLMYFTIYFAERYPEHPGISVAKALILYCFYLIFVKQLPQTLILGLFLLVAAFVCEQYKDYNNAQTIKQNDEEVKKLELAEIILISLCAGISIIGFGIAFKHSKTTNVNITLLKYIFRDYKCSP